VAVVEGTEVVRVDTSFIEEVNRRSGQVIQRCYHCHKCTAGCPTAFAMEYGPDKVLRMIEFGLKDRVLASSDIWICANCETCGTRCPNDINISQVMDALRQIAMEEGVPSAEPAVTTFHPLFLFFVRWQGRMYEAALMGLHKLINRDFSLDVLPDLGAGMKMFIKGKLPLLPHRIRPDREVGAIFEKAEKGQ
jgi:heterodisulfide reductase subunit C